MITNSNWPLYKLPLVNNTHTLIHVYVRLFYQAQIQQRVIQSVLDEQDRQEENNANDHILIALSSSVHSEALQVRAHMIGLYHARECS